MKEGEFLKVNEHLKEVLNMNHNLEDLGFLGEAYLISAIVAFIN